MSAANDLNKQSFSDVQFDEITSNGDDSVSATEKQIAAALNKKLSVVLNDTVGTAAHSRRKLTFKQFLKQNHQLASVFQFSIKPFSGHGYWIFDRVAASYFVSALQGNTKNDHNLSDLSQLDLKHLQRIAELINESYQAAWSERCQLETFLTNRYVDIRSMNTLQEEEEIFLTPFMLESSSNLSQLHLLIPKSTDQKLKDFLQMTSLKKEEGHASPSKKELFKVVLQTEVEIKAVLGEASILVKDLLDLANGDILQLDCPADNPLKVKIQGKTKFKARPGVVNGKCAIKIVDEID